MNYCDCLNTFQNKPVFYYYFENPIFHVKDLAFNHLLSYYHCNYKVNWPLSIISRNDGAGFPINHPLARVGRFKLNTSLWYQLLKFITVPKTIADDECAILFF